MMESISLLHLAKEGKIEKTGAKPELPSIIGDFGDQIVDVYKVPIDLLFYNDQNGRIASERNRFDSNLVPQNDLTNPTYNDAFAKMVEAGNPAALKKTMKSIKEDGQAVFAYVLDDGRIIDGNRRFTAIRKLAKESGQTYFLNAVILPLDYSKVVDRKKIKDLELSIQKGIEDREKYDVVDDAVDMFLTVEVEKTMSAADYARRIRSKATTVENAIGAVKMMQDFLRFIKAESVTDYFIIKDTKTFSLFSEGYKKFKKQFPYDNPEKQQSIEAYFGFILVQIQSTEGGTKAYDTREYFKSVVAGADRSAYNDKVEDVIDDLRDQLDAMTITDTAQLTNALSKPELKSSLREISETYTVINKKNTVSNDFQKFVDEFKKISLFLEDIEVNDGLMGKLSFDQLDEQNIKDLSKYSKSIMKNSAKLVDIYDNEL